MSNNKTVRIRIYQAEARLGLIEKRQKLIEKGRLEYKKYSKGTGSRQSNNKTRGLLTELRMQLQSRVQQEISKTKKEVKQLHEDWVDSSKDKIFERSKWVKRYWWLCLLIIVAYTLFLIITPFYVFPREEQTGVKWGLSLTGAMLGSYAIPNHFTFTKTWTGWWNE